MWAFNPHYLKRDSINFGVCQIIYTCWHYHYPYWSYCDDFKQQRTNILLKNENIEITFKRFTIQNSGCTKLIICNFIILNMFIKFIADFVSKAVCMLLRCSQKLTKVVKVYFHDFQARKIYLILSFLLFYRGLAVKS